MVEIASGVCVHLLDPMPGVVVTRVTDGLRERGHRVELRGDSLAASDVRLTASTILGQFHADRDVTDVYLTSRPLASATGDPVHGIASRTHRSAIVGIPTTSEHERFRPEVAGRVLDLVLRELGRLQHDD